MDHSAELAREAAAGFADKLRLIIPTEEIRLHGMKFDADLFDVEVEHNGWGITVSFDKRGKSLRLLLDDYVIENLTEKDALSFIDALAAGRAKVRVSKVPVFGKTVRLELQARSSQRFSTRRRWGPGLADWERSLLASNASV